MPFRVRKQVTNRGQYAVQKKVGTAWRTVSRHSTEKKAKASKRIREQESGD